MFILVSFSHVFKILIYYPWKMIKNIFTYAFITTTVSILFQTFQIGFAYFWKIFKTYGAVEFVYNFLNDPTSGYEWVAVIIICILYLGNFILDAMITELNIVLYEVSNTLVNAAAIILYITARCYQFFLTDSFCLNCFKYIELQWVQELVLEPINFYIKTTELHFGDRLFSAIYIDTPGTVILFNLMLNSLKRLWQWDRENNLR